MTPNIDSADYYAAMQGNPEIKYRAQILDKRLKELTQGTEPKILEIGVGGGDITLLLASQYEHLSFVEPDPAICNLVIDRLKSASISSIKHVCSGIEQADFAMEQFDHIIMLGLLEHLIDPGLVLRKVADLLKPYGRVHLTVNLAGSLHRWLGLEMGMLETLTSLTTNEINHGHYRVYTHESILDELDNTGFSISHQQTYYLKPFPTSSLIHLTNEQHDALFKLGDKFKDLASYIYIEATKRQCV